MAKRKFNNFIVAATDFKFTLGHYTDENEQAVKLRLPGKWKIEQVFAGKTDEKDTIIVIDKRK
jgi:hypothetical protein